MNQTKRSVVSRDGTEIAYEKVGAGPAVVLVDGALVYRAMWGGGPLAALLADRFTVYTYDRRGRGESGKAGRGIPPELAVEQEIADLEAVIDQAGGLASLYGISSGAALVFEAALRLGNKVRKIALYEAPYNSEESSRRNWKEYTRDINQFIAAGRMDDTVLRFARLTGASAEDAEQMRQMPFFSAMAAVAPTLAYDAAVMGEESALPLEKAARLSTPALVLYGGQSYPFMRIAAEELVRVMPNARLLALPDQTHEVAPEAIAPALIEFFQSEP